MWFPVFSGAWTSPSVTEILFRVTERFWGALFCYPFLKYLFPLQPPFSPYLHPDKSLFQSMAGSGLGWQHSPGILLSRLWWCPPGRFQAVIHKCWAWTDDSACACQVLWRFCDNIPGVLSSLWHLLRHFQMVLLCIMSSWIFSLILWLISVAGIRL